MVATIFYSTLLHKSSIYNNQQLTVTLLTRPSLPLVSSFLSPSGFAVVVVSPSTCSGCPSSLLPRVDEGATSAAAVVGSGDLLDGDAVEDSGGPVDELENDEVTSWKRT